MTNKKFKKAAMALALTACVAATPLAANAETPENAADVQAPAAVDHTEADTQEAPEAELPVEEEPEAQPTAEAAAQPAAPEATPIAVELPTAEETPEDEEAPEEKEETPVEVTPTEDAVVEKETPAKIAPAPAKVAPAPAKADVDNLIEDPDADIATMDGAENAVSDEYEAKIGETSYGTLQKAIDGAKDGDTVVLNKNTSGSINIAKWIKLNLNDHTINGDVKVDLSKKQDDAATTQDGETTVDKKVEIVDGTITGGTDSGVKIIGADVKLENVNVTGNSSQGNGGGIYVEDGSVEIIGGSVSNNTAVGLPDQSGIQGGGGIYAVRSDVVLKDTTVSNNTVTGANSDGGGVLVKNGSLTVTDSTISDNTAPDQGGGIVAAWSGLEITDSTISGNKAAVGAGILTEDNKAAGEHTHTITNSNIQNNEASNIGGGVYVGTCSDMTITDSTLSGNTATNQGGAIVAYSARNVTLDHTTVKGNKAAIGGGILSFGTALADTHITLKNGTEVTGNTATSGAGLYAWSVGSNPVQIDIEKSSITNNTATNAGGGIFAYIGVKVRADGADISGNKAVNGGGLYLYGTAADPSRTTVDLINKTTITNNSATSYGGGIFAYDGVKVTADDIELSGNTAANAGGILLWSTDKAPNSVTGEVTNSTIANNTATGSGYGGGIYALNSKLTASNNKILENKAQGGAGVYLSASDATLTGNTFDGNTANGSGGGIYTYDPSGTAERTITLTDNIFTNNKALVGNGGGIQIANKNQTVTIKGGSFDGNSATYGGGISVASGSELTMEGTTVTNNTATKVGGGIYHVSPNKTIDLRNVTIQGNQANAGAGIYLFASNARLVTDSLTTISNNIAKNFGGGIYVGQKGTLDLSNGAVYNNHAGRAGDDLYLKAKTNSTLILRPVGDDWVLDDCDHAIDGWYLDYEGERWNADGLIEEAEKFAAGLDTRLEFTTVTDNGDGTFTLTTTDGSFTVQKFADGHYEIHMNGDKPLALKAAHDVIPEPTPEPTPDPDPEPTPGPDTPDTPVSPEDPTTPPVQDATPDDAETPVTPENPETPPVQDATPDTVAALPKTGVNWFTALAMALSGMALMAAGAFTSLFAKSKH